MEKLLGKDKWHEHLDDCKLQTPSHAGAGGKYNGQDLKNILKHDNLKKLAPRLPNGEIITAYMSALDQLHTMCVAKSVIPYDVWGICRRFRETFEKVYWLGYNLSATPKIHICWVHIPEWYMLEETGLHTLYMSDCSYGEAAHGKMKRLEESRNLEVRRNRGSQRELNSLESTVAAFNWSNDVIPTDTDEAIVEINEVSEQAGFVSQATEIETIQPLGHDVSLITLKLDSLFTLY